MVINQLTFLKIASNCTMTLCVETFNLKGFNLLMGCAYLMGTFVGGIFQKLI